MDYLIRLSEGEKKVVSDNRELLTQKGWNNKKGYLGIFNGRIVSYALSKQTFLFQ